MPGRRAPRPAHGPRGASDVVRRRDDRRGPLDGGNRGAGRGRGRTGAGRAAGREVSAAAGLPPLGELAPPQRETIAALIRMCLRQAQDLVDDPGRPPGWTFTHPDILAGWGRGSAMIPGLLAAAAPQFAEV